MSVTAINEKLFKDINFKSQYFINLREREKPFFHFSINKKNPLKMLEKKSIAICGITMVLGMLVLNNTANAATYKVGDATGWTFNVAGWENGKNFKADDVLGINLL